MTGFDDNEVGEFSQGRSKVDLNQQSDQKLIRYENSQMCLNQPNFKN
jgi:hypothetical protein